MKTNYTDEQLQAAIDEACLEIHRNHRVKVGSTLIIAPNALSSAYAAEESVRLDLIKSALAALPEPMDEESMLLNLLAVIHRDGGHYQAEHGTRKAVEDACKEWQRLISIVEKTWLTEPEPETFEAHGKTWNVHNKGDTLPCAGNILVEVIDGDIILNPIKTESWNWKDGNFRGWRYADEPTPEPLVTKPISLTSPTQINDGGPAFPNLGYNKEANYNGMTLRDWFAGQALAGIVQAVVTASLHNSAQTPDDEVTARWALKIADAMLAAREVKP